MTDYCLKMPTQADFDALMLSTGLGIEADGQVVPASYEILIDRIGPITMNDITYPEFYANLRFLSPLTDEQAAALNAYAIDPSQPQYRVWA